MGTDTEHSIDLSEEERDDSSLLSSNTRSFESEDAPYDSTIEESTEPTAEQLAARERLAALKPRLSDKQLAGSFECRKRDFTFLIGLGFVVLTLAGIFLEAIQPLAVSGYRLVDLFLSRVFQIVQLQFGLSLLLYPAAVAIGQGYLFRWLNEFSQTNEIEIEHDGIVLGWRGVPQQLLPWRELTSVFLFRPEGTMLPRKWLVGFGYSSTRPVKVQIDVVTPIGQELLSVLKEKAPWISIDPDLIEIFEPAITDSRTELWMKSISQAPQEEQLLPLSPGDKLNGERYEIIGRIGVGGQGTAYLAKDLETDTDVVIKESLFPVYVDSKVREEYSRRFQCEVELLQRFDHPSVVRLLDSFQSPHRGYLVLSLINGDSLRKRVQNAGRMDEKTVRNLLDQMIDILTYLHTLSPSVVHRDFTPDNLILDNDGRLVLIDFNVAREMLSTKTATVVGKHAYIPAEQFRGQFDERSDIYALGCTLHFLLTGEDPEPITQSNVRDVVEQTSEQMNSLVAKCTEQEATDRFQQILELESFLSENEVEATKA